VRALELKVPPPVVAFLIGVAMWFAFPHGVPVELSLVARITAFAVIALAGGAIALAGELEFRRARTTINPFKPENSTTLVTSGIYRITRNPMYVGLTLVLVGWAAFLWSAWALPGPVVFALYITRFQIAPEERALCARFGETYAQYAAHVRRWL